MRFIASFAGFFAVLVLVLPAHPYRLQLVRSNGTTAWLGGVRRTTTRGFFTAPVPRGSVVRLYSVRGRSFGVPVLIR